MKLTKNTIRELIKEEIVNERRERERTPAFAYLRKVQDYFEDVREDIAEGEFLFNGNTPELKKVQQEWIDVLSQGRLAASDLFIKLTDQLTKIEEQIKMLNLAKHNARRLQRYVSYKADKETGSTKPPKFETKLPEVKSQDLGFGPMGDK
tara:strand:+ start:1855 stop:2304 length:450 start_codon:yes stop_codon:yes gene_type:complete